MSGAEAARLFNEAFARSDALIRACLGRPLVDTREQAGLLADGLVRLLFATRPKT